MKILSIETSCDETAISLVEANGELDSPSFSVLGNSLFSQIELHKQYGGVFPTLAKREHAKNLPPILEKVLTEAKVLTLSRKSEYSEETWSEIEEILKKEEGLYANFRSLLEPVEKPELDVISVTYGPGLEPALWVGICFAQALSKLWDIPVLGINHMEGHIASVLMKESGENFKQNVKFPALAVLISGGHTEIVKMKKWGEYEVIGETVDDAVGEAFDKTARLLGLPYPGGPEISRLAEVARNKNLEHKAKLPRPMLHSKNLNFSFSGLKTAVLYYIRDNFGESFENMTENDKADLAREFEDSVLDVLKTKTKEALDKVDAKTLIIAGGVIANQKIRDTFEKLAQDYVGLEVKIPTRELATDNALMIASATYINMKTSPEIIYKSKKIMAKGNLRFA